MTQRHTIIGAFGCSGKYIAQRLLDLGHQVDTVTNSPNRANRFDGKVKAYPFNSDEPDKLAQTAANPASNSPAVATDNQPTVSSN